MLPDPPRIPPPAEKDTVMVSPARTVEGPDMEALPAANAAGTALASKTSTSKREISFFKINTPNSCIFAGMSV